MWIFLPPASSPVKILVEQWRAENAGDFLSTQMLMDICELRSLRGQNLAGADLSGGYFKDADFHGAKLNNVYFQNACLDGAKLFKTSIGGAKFDGASLVGASFHGCRILRSRHHDDYDSGGGASFDGATLVNTSFWKAQVPSTNFNNAILRGVDFSHADISDSHFTHLDLNQVELHRAILRGISAESVAFGNADLPPGQYWNLRVQGPEPTPQNAQEALDLLGLESFAGADLRGIQFVGTDLSGTDFSGADLRYAFFDSVDASGARFVQADLRHSIVANSSFRRADFAEANLSGMATPLYGCIPAMNDFSDTIVNPSTLSLC